MRFFETAKYVVVDKKGVIERREYETFFIASTKKKIREQYQWLQQLRTNI